MFVSKKALHRQQTGFLPVFTEKSIFFKKMLDFTYYVLHNMYKRLFRNNY